MTFFFLILRKIFDEKNCEIKFLFSSCAPYGVKQILLALRKLRILCRSKETCLCLAANVVFKMSPNVKKYVNDKQVVFKIYPNRFWSFFGRFLDYLPKFRCWPKFRFLNKISICGQNYNFLSKFLFLIKISIFDQNFDLWPKFRFLAND